MFTFYHILTVQSGGIIESITKKDSADTVISSSSASLFKTSIWEVEITSTDGIGFIVVTQNNSNDCRKFFPLEDGLLLLGSNDAPAGYHILESRFIPDSHAKPVANERNPGHELLMMGINQYNESEKILREYTLNWTDGGYTVLIADTDVRYKFHAAGNFGKVTCLLEGDARVVLMAVCPYPYRNLNGYVKLIANEPLSTGLVEYLRGFLIKLNLRSFTELFELRETILLQAKANPIDQTEAEEVQGLNQTETEEDETN